MIKKILAAYAKMSKRERWICYVTVAVIGALMLDQLVVGPVFDKMVFLENEIQSQKAAIQKSMHVLLRKDQIVAEGKQLAPYLVDSNLPEEKEMTSLLKEMENMAKQATVNVNYVKPGTIEQQAGVKRYSASMECEAEMPEIVSLLYAIENSKKLFLVEKYEIQPKNKDSAIARCTLTVSKSIFLPGAAS